MPAIAYPVIAHAADILKDLSGLNLAERERQAAEISKVRVKFVSETLDPAFATKDEAEAYFNKTCPGLIEQPFAVLQCRIKGRKSGEARLTASLETGKRWPSLKTPPQSQWQLVVSYWKILPKRAATPHDPNHINPALQARAMRKQELGQALTPAELRALAHTPMVAYRPQKALDIGLFEVRPPDDPTILIPDE